MYGEVKVPSRLHLFEVRAEWSKGVEGSLEGQCILLSKQIPGQVVVWLASKAISVRNYKFLVQQA